MKRLFSILILMMLSLPSGRAEDKPGLYEVRGVVQTVAADGLTAVIKHEEVSDYMPAMTMPFHALQTNAWTGVRPGDKVTFLLHILSDRSWIDQVKRVGHEEARNTASREAAASPPPSPSHHPLRDFKFTNELGAPVSFSDFRGQVVVYTFFFTRCPVPEYCPRLSRNFEEVLRKLAGRPDLPTNWHLISVSFDPDFDQPDVLKQYAKRYHYDANHWTFLTGPKEKIAELANLSDATYSPDSGLFTHNFRTLVVDPQGRLQMSFPIGGDISDAIVDEIQRALGETNRISLR